MSDDGDDIYGEEALTPIRPTKGKKGAVSIEALLPSEVPEGEDTDRVLAFFPLNDFGNAKRLIVRFGEDLMFVRDVGWYAWNGACWNHADGADEAVKKAHMVAQAIAGEVKALKETPGKAEERIPPLARHCVQSGNAARVASMLSTAATYLTVPGDTLDTDPHLLAAPNGTVRLGTHCAMRGSVREDRITRVLGVDYAQGASCPKFESFLVDIMPDPDMRAFLQRIFGYCLTASTIEQAFFIFWGSGNNGKSVLMNLMRAAMGEYAMNSPVSTFLAKREGNGGSEASPDLARLPGARLVTAAEPPEGARLDEAKVKEMSSGELMTARHLNQGFFDYRPVFKAIISTNHRPTIRGADHGIWRRIRLVPFTVQIEADKVDRNLEAKLMKELPGILQWMITGAEEWFAVGLRPPAKAIAAVEDYRASEDPVGEFLKARCELTRDAQDPSTGRAYEISAKRLRAEYKAWCEEEGLEPLGAKTFGSKVIARGITTRKSMGLTLYVGVHLNSDPIPGQGE
jgi:putative DNA primase/helicase